jgi:hypothetical protein
MFWAEDTVVILLFILLPFRLVGFLPLPPSGGLGKAPMITYESGAFQQGILFGLKSVAASGRKFLFIIPRTAAAKKAVQ